MNKPTFISTFAGCGGSSLGYKWAGYKELLAIEWETNAVDTFKLNFPDVPVWQRDIKEVTSKEILDYLDIKVGELDLLDGSPPCFPEDISIITKQGIKLISEIQVGEYILTHKLRWKKVLKTGSQQADTIILKGQGHYGLETTQNHPFYARKLERKWNNKKRSYERDFLNPEWIDARELKANKCFWGSPSKFPQLTIPEILVQNKRSHIFNMNKEFMFILGVWIGDGWARTGKTFKGNNRRGEVYICTNKNETHILEQKLINANIRFSKSHEKTTDRFCICSKPLTEWLIKNMNRYSDKKTFPIWLYGLSYEMRKAFYDGYIFADGHYNKEKKFYKITTVSKKLAIGIRLLANTLNMSTSITLCKMKPQTIIENRIVNQKDFYSISIYKTFKSNFTENNINWGKVKQILPGNNQKVYNIEVEDDNSYIADGIIVHNCQGFSTAGKREVNDIRNDLFMDYIRLVKGLQPKVFVMENVSGMIKGKMKGRFIEIMQLLKSMNYNVKCKLMNAKYYQVPQSRERLIFIGVRKDLEIEPSYPEPSKVFVIVRDTIGHLPLGRPGKHSKQVIAAWFNSKPNQSLRKVNRYVGSFQSVRLNPNKPSPTQIKSHYNWHYKIARQLSIVEAGLIQSFPEGFEWGNKRNNAKERIGNSVPPKFMQAIAEHIKDNILSPTEQPELSRENK